VPCAKREEVIPRHQLLVGVAIADSAGLKVDDLLEFGQLVEHLERLVHLLLVLGDQHSGPGMRQ
jgi:hypothetical protein